MERAFRLVANLIVIALFLLFTCALCKYIIIDHIGIFTIESPLAFAALIAVALIVLIFLDLRKELRLDSEPRPAVTVEGGEHVGLQFATILIFAAATIAYILLLKYLHFLLGSFIFMVLGMCLLNDVTKSLGGRILRAGAAGLVAVPILYVIFDIAFDVILP